MADHTTDAVSRRNVLKTAGGLLAGSTMFAGLSAAMDGNIEYEVEEATEEYIAVRVSMSEGLMDQNGDPASAAILGLADRFVIHEDEEAVSLPEDSEGLAAPVDKRKVDEQTYRMYFRTGDIAWPEEYEEGEEVTLGLGVFPDRTVPRSYWDTETMPGIPKYG